MECRQSGLTDHNHTAEQKKQFRLEKEKPILDAFWNWLEQQRPNKGARLAKAVNMIANALTIFTRGSSRSIKLRFSRTSPFACPESIACGFFEPTVSEVPLASIFRVATLPFCLRSSAITRSASTSISVCEWEMMSMVTPCAWRVWMRSCTRVVAASSNPPVAPAQPPYGSLLPDLPSFSDR